jgi:hypothetical protein
MISYYQLKLIYKIHYSYFKANHKVNINPQNFMRNIMRKCSKPQLQIGQVDIQDIIIDLNDRDELPQLLLGLKAIHSNAMLKKSIFEILEKSFGKQANLRKGRPGMDLWNILVLGLVRLCCNWDFDKLRDIANNHRTLRAFLGHSQYDEFRYALQTIKDNVKKFNVVTLNQISQLMAAHGHSLTGGKSKTLNLSADSFVVETNVHFPTDISLLWDAHRCAIRLIMKLCKELDLSDWRQGDYQKRKLKKSLRIVSKLRKSTAKDEKIRAKKEEQLHQSYRQALDIAIQQSQKMSLTLDSIKDPDEFIQNRINLIKEYLAHSARQIDQIERRVLKGETIPHNEKVFSIFQPHTEWISKGKAGVPVELGLKVCIVKDQYGLILNYQVMENQTDEKIAVPLLETTTKAFPNVASCSFDKGFHSKSNQEKLATMIDRVVMPRKGKLSAKASAIENEPEFIRLRHQHSSVESSINALENHGLDRCLDHGIVGFKRYVALAILARNIQIVGRMLQIKELRKQQKANLKKQKYLIAA